MRQGQTYKINNFDKKKLNFVAIGCHGTGDEAQKEVASALRNYVRKNGTPDFILVLGDNIYNDGVSSFNDPKFKQQFFDIYCKGKELKDIPFITVLGNHDVDKKNGIKEYLDFSGAVRGNEEKGFFQAEHTYCDPSSNKINSRKFRKIQQAASSKNIMLSLKDIKGWFMPNQYYRLNIGKQAVFLCLNSNTLARDCLLFMNNTSWEISGKRPLENKILAKANELKNQNQFAWLLTQKDTLKDKKLFIAMHHGFKSTGKRAFITGHDTNHYLTALEQKEFSKKCLYGYNEILQHVILDLLDFKQHKPTLFNAHDHHQLYHVDEDFTQVTIGGGGGQLQCHEFYGDYKKQPLHESFNGVARCSINMKEPARPDSLAFLPVTTNGKITLDEKYVYFLGRCEPKKLESAPPVQVGINGLYKKIIEQAVDVYFDKMTSNNTKSTNEMFTTTRSFKNLLAHGREGIIRGFSLLNLFQQHDMPYAVLLIKQIRNILQGSGYSEDSLRTCVFNEYNKYIAEGKNRGLIYLLKKECSHKEWSFKEIKTAYSV